MRTKVCVLGLGLIGGSVLRAVSAAGHDSTGFDVSRAARDEAAAAAGAGGWRIADSIGHAVTGVDVTVLAVPLPAVGAVLDELARIGYSGLLTDVTSVKVPVHTLVKQRIPGARYVGGHPMAGSEHSGFAASDPDLFAGCAWALTLGELSPEPARAHTGSATESRGLDDWLLLAELVTGLGARVVPVTAEDHDAAVAQVSHLPHLVAAALASAADSGLAASLAAGSYRDGTRVAASAPDLVAAMCGGNAGAVTAALDRLLADLREARGRLGEADPVTALAEWLRAGHAVRARWPAPPGEPRNVPVSVPALLELGRAGGWVVSVPEDRRTVVAVQPLR